MPTWIITILIGLGGFAAGIAATVLAVRRSRPVARSPAPASRPAVPTSTAAKENSGQAGDADDLPRHALALIGSAIREPLARLRRVDSTPAEIVEQLERIAWQTRMLTAVPRPMQAHPTSPIALLEQAVESVSLLRLGKVPASWTLRNRQPVHVDAQRTQAAFRELLCAAAEAAGEGGRVGIRILRGRESRYPVEIEVEVGQRGAEPDSLALLVARRLLESQGARLEAEGQVMRVFLRSAGPEPAAQTASNR